MRSVPPLRVKVPPVRLFAAEMLKLPAETVSAVEEAWLSILRTKVPVLTLFNV